MTEGEPDRTGQEGEHARPKSTQIKGQQQTTGRSNPDTKEETEERVWEMAMLRTAASQGTHLPRSRFR